MRDIPHLEEVAAATGFRIAKIRYYTPLVGGFVENIVIRMAERALARRAAVRLSQKTGSRKNTDEHGHGLHSEVTEAAEADAAIREARAAAKERIATSPATYAALRGLSYAMKLDLLLFGRIRSGPFFAVLEKK